MIRRILPLLLAAVLGSAAAAPGPYTAAGGDATFDHRVAIVNVHGTIAGVTAAVRVDPADLAVVTGTVTVPVAALKTGIGARDTHARSARALDTDRWPDAVFTITGLPGGRLTEGQTLETTASGTLTVKGTARTISAPVKATLRGGRIEVATQFKFNPLEYGVAYPGSSSTVTVNVTFTLVPGA